jgi:putative FmdB family regulatory protein
MPTYEYQCPECQTEETIVRRLNEKEIKPVCECGAKMTRVFGIAAVTFKGTGWGGKA